MSRLEPIAYRDGEVPLTGLHGVPERTPRAAVAVFPTFMNSTPGVEAKAQALVEAGYAVLIGDFYGPDAPSNFEEAFAAMTRLRSDPHAARARFRATIELMRGLHPDMPHFAIGFVSVASQCSSWLATGRS